MPKKAQSKSEPRTQRKKRQTQQQNRNTAHIESMRTAVESLLSRLPERLKEQFIDDGYINLPFQLVHSLKLDGSANMEVLKNYALGFLDTDLNPIFNQKFHYDEPEEEVGDEEEEVEDHLDEGEEEESEEEYTDEVGPSSLPQRKSARIAAKKEVQLAESTQKAKVKSKRPIRAVKPEARKGGRLESKKDEKGKRTESSQEKQEQVVDDKNRRQGRVTDGQVENILKSLTRSLTLEETSRSADYLVLESLAGCGEQVMHRENKFTSQKKGNMQVAVIVAVQDGTKLSLIPRSHTDPNRNVSKMLKEKNKLVLNMNARRGSYLLSCSGTRRRGL